MRKVSTVPLEQSLGRWRILRSTLSSTRVTEEKKESAHHVPVGAATPKTVPATITAITLLLRKSGKQLELP
jgi:hypothetical protein